MSQSRFESLPFFPKWTSVVTERRHSDMYVELLNMPPIEVSSDEDDNAAASPVTTEHFAVGSSSSLASQSDSSMFPPHGVSSADMLVNEASLSSPSHDGTKSFARASKPTKWGRCMQCNSAMRPIVLPSGRSFLGCSKHQSKNPSSCSWTCAVPPQLYHRLPDLARCRLRVQF